VNYFQFLKSLDDLLYEVVSWLVFYPITLWRTLKRPIAMMEYAANELHRPDEERFDDALSPPILLLITVLVAHAFELALVGDSEIVASKTGVAAVISDDTSLIMFRLVAFASFPLIFAVRSVRVRGLRLTRGSLEPAFFAQCYGNAPFALIVSLCATLWQLRDPIAQTVAVTITLLGTCVFWAIETQWFRKTLRVSLAEAAWNTAVSYVGAFAFMIALGWLVAGTG
jgi:hypothetical protein